jgi:hypothetical protein
LWGNIENHVSICHELLKVPQDIDEPTLASCQGPRNGPISRKGVEIRRTLDVAKALNKIVVVQDLHTQGHWLRSQQVARGIERPTVQPNYPKARAELRVGIPPDLGLAARLRRNAQRLNLRRERERERERERPAIAPTIT